MKEHTIALLVMSSLLGGCGEPDYLSLSGPTMGTTFVIKARPASSINAEQLQQHVTQLLATINATMSTYDNNSELSRLNRNPSTEWIDASPELMLVLRAALEVSELSQGAFDVTVGPLVNVWGFGPNRQKDQIPSADEIAAAQQRIGYQQLRLRNNPPAVRKQRSDIYIDLSAIAKGHAVDEIGTLLERYEITDYLVDIGGELLAKGRNAQGENWRIAIEKPNSEERAIQRTVRISDRGMATSGNYRNFFELKGQRYSHIINPHSGWPIKHDLASVTVISSSAMQADALATMLLVLGADKGLQLAQEQQLAAFFIMIENNSFTEKSTAAFQPYLQASTK